MFSLNQLLINKENKKSCFETGFFKDFFKTPI